jgi:hypothetical protein
MHDYKLPTKQINVEFVHGLEVVSNKVYPLPGATFERSGDIDPRLNTSTTSSSLSSISTSPNKITYFEHVATIRHRTTNTYFVAFRETMDALLARQSDIKKYPEWLIKSGIKQTELKIYIYKVKETSTGVPIRPSKLCNLSTHEDWLEHLGNCPDWLWQSLSYFLLQSNVITQEMYSSMPR